MPRYPLEGGLRPELSVGQNRVVADEFTGEPQSPVL